MTNNQATGVDSVAILAAVVRAKGGPFQTERAVLRGPRALEVLVRLEAVGVCHTDAVVRDQHYPVPLPLVLGHEGSGVVERIGEGVTRLAVGDHVVLTFATCGVCKTCARGEPTYCEHFFPLNFGGCGPDGDNAITDADGVALHDHFFGQSSFATHAIATERNAIKVRRDAPLALLGPLGCGIQTGAGAVLKALRVKPASSFAAFGAGAVGLSAVMAAKLAGASIIIAVDIVPARLELALDLGATHVIDARDGRVVERVAELTGGGADYSLESTGRPEIVRQAIDALGLRGVCGIVGAPPLGAEAKIDINGVMVPGKTVRGIVEGDSVPSEFIPELVEFYMQGRFPFDRLIQEYAFADINQAMDDSAAGRTIKPVLRMPQALPA